MMNTKKEGSKWRRSPRISKVPNNSMSASHMGRALVLLATSCAAFRSGHSTIAPLTTTQSRSRSVIKAGSSQERTLRRRSVRSVAMRYRNGDEDQPIDMQISNADGAVSMSTDMDEYIEYLDRRYSRMHQDTEVSRPRSLFSLVSFSPSISPPATTSTDTDARDHEDMTDPLHIMGISSLASVRLRQRLGMSRGDSKVVLLASPRLLDSSLSSQSSITSLNQVKLMLNSLHKLVPSSRIVTTFVSLMLDTGGFSVASLAILFMARPLLKGAGAFRQG